jgi:DNA topoisomerase VI subunit B
MHLWIALKNDTNICMGNTTKKILKSEREDLNKSHGKKIKYRLREVQEEEAEHEIEDYIRVPDESIEDLSSGTE